MYISTIDFFLFFIALTSTELASTSVQKHVKKLPLGVTNIHQILEEDYVYVDKTGLIYDMMVEHNYDYFMVRPRGFGKTLFLSTLEEIFKGKKELFEGTAIHRSQYNWLEYPVLRFDFSRMDCREPQKFENSLKKELKKMANITGVAAVEGTDSQSQMKRLIEDLFHKSGTRVVILVDEYDSPITKNLKNVGMAEKFRNILLNFLTALTSVSDNFLQFTFVTGVHQFSVCSSQACNLDNLVDLTLNPKYSTLMGFTEEELEANFADYLRDVNASILDGIRTHYNGYRFSETEASVYSPHLMLTYLSAKHADEGTKHYEKIPAFLIDSVRKDPQIMFDLKTSATDGYPLRLPIDISKRINLEPFLLQSGHLTIRGYSVRDDWGYYKLDFRNNDVRNTFFRSFLEGLTDLDPVEIVRDSEKIKQDLADLDMYAFISEMYIHISRIPIQIRRLATLEYYRAVFYLLLENLGIETEVEYGCTRMKISNSVCLFHFTFNQTADTALERIVNLYKEKIAPDTKTFCVGINFGIESSNINDWKSVLYENGEIVRIVPSYTDLNQFHFALNVTNRSGNKTKS